MKEIVTSAKNPYIQYLQSLNQKKNREIEGKFLIEGLRFVEAALKAKAPVEEIIVSPEFQEKMPDLFELLPSHVPITVVSGHLFKKFTGTENPQEIVALLSKKEYAADDLFQAENPLILIIEEVQDPGNLGTIIRTADAAGVTGIVLIKGTVDLYNAKTLRSTMGSVFHVPVVNAESITDVCRMLRQKGFKILAADLSAEAKDYLKVDFTASTALIIGNEAKGISAMALADADEHITINMPGKAESLNAAVATGVLLFEAARQRRG